MTFQSGWIVLLVFLLGACASVSNPDARFPDLSVSEGEELDSLWEGFNRFPPRYPEFAAKSAEMGCATVEYVILPGNKVTDIFVTTSTSSQFSRSARRVIARWPWQSLDSTLVKEPIKTRTRFDFCLEGGEVSCVDVLKDLECEGEDTIVAKGIAL